MYKLSKMIRAHERYTAEAMTRTEYSDMVRACFGDITAQLGCDLQIVKTSPHGVILCLIFPQGDLKVRLKPSFHGVEPFVSADKYVDVDFRYIVETFKEQLSGREPLELLRSLGKGKEMTEWLVEKT